VRINYFLGVVISDRGLWVAGAGAAAAEVGLRLLLGRKLVFGNITLVDPTFNFPVGGSVETFEFV
jgi:hypothetical protein